MSMMTSPLRPEDESAPDRERPSGETPSPLDDAEGDQEGTASKPGAGRSADELLPVVYDELRRIAQRAMARERAGHTLQATALVHEAYARLIGGHDPGWENSAHFFRAAARADAEASAAVGGAEITRTVAKD